MLFEETLNTQKNLATNRKGYKLNTELRDLRTAFIR